MKAVVSDWLSVVSAKHLALSIQPSAELHPEWMGKVLRFVSEALLAHPCVTQVTDGDLLPLTNS